MKYFYLALIFFNTLAFSAPKTEIWSEILDKAVTSKGEVDYVWIKKNSSKLNSFITSYASVNPEKWNELEKKSHYINFYNAAMIFNLLKYAEDSKIAVESKSFLNILINKISVSGGNIWNGTYKVNIAGLDVNLDEIEHGLIRGKILKSKSKWHLKELDPRVHAALNCSAVSCPILSNESFKPETIERKLDELFINWIGEEYQFKKLGSTFRINKIIKWYFEDFASYKAPPSWTSCKGKPYIQGSGNYLCHYLNLSKASNKVWKTEKFATLNSSSSLYNPFNGLSFDYDWHINSKRQMMTYIDKLK